MTTATIQRQYNEVIAANYDLDPQLVIHRALERALAQVKHECCLAVGMPSLKVLDIGMGTGLFFERLRGVCEREIEPFGLDISERMVEIAKNRIPNLTAAIDDAANVDANFDGETFDLICTHFITGFVPIDHLAPRIWNKLKPGGVWSFVGGTSHAFPTLQSKANSRWLRMLFGGGQVDSEDFLTPVDCAAVVRCFERNSFDTCSSEMFEPELTFNNFDEFMEFAYRGGWLTPFVEDLGLQKIGSRLQALLNALVFPMRDRHRIAIALARRPVT